VGKIQAALNYLEKIFLAGGCISILAIMLVTTFDLLSRKFWDYSIPSLYEFTEDYLMVGLVFLTISYVYKAGGHVRVTILEKYLPASFKGPREKVLKLLAFFLFLFITVKGWDVTVRAFQFQEVSNSVLAYPLAPAFLLVPLGSALVCIRIFQSFFTSWEAEERHDHGHSGVD
jgi:TRAP-type C4-dicarboxylate transport system permease small subunit